MLVQTFTDENMEEIIQKKRKQGYKLIQIQNITEGNFLIFLSENETEPKSEIEQIKERITDLEILISPDLGL